MFATHVLAYVTSLFLAHDGLDLKSLRAQVIPAKIEPWQLVPWETDLAVARRRAADEQKPLFMWAMNGHPCGST